MPVELAGCLQCLEHVWSEMAEATSVWNNQTLSLETGWQSYAAARSSVTFCLALAHQSRKKGIIQAKNA